MHPSDDPTRQRFMAGGLVLALTVLYVGHYRPGKPRGTPSLFTRQPAARSWTAGGP